MKRTVCLFLALALLCGCTAKAPAATGTTAATQQTTPETTPPTEAPQETTAAAEPTAANEIPTSEPSALARMLPVLYTQANQAGEDRTDTLKGAISLLFTAMSDMVCSETCTDPDFSMFWAEDVLDEADIAYLMRHLQAVKQYRLLSGRYFRDGSVSIDYDSISITDGIADVRLHMYFSFTYYTEDAGYADRASGYGREYTIRLYSIDGSWRISDIEFTCAMTEALRNSAVDVAQFAAELFEQNHTPSVPAGEAPGAYVPPESESMAFRALDVDRFVEYALRYAGCNRSALFPDFSGGGGNCQNYSSQCIYYALGGEEDADAIASLSEPMLGPGMGAYAWYITPYGEDFSYTWTLTDEFAWYVGNGGDAIPGLCGTIYPGVAYAQPGDIVQMSKDGGESFFHSVVVVGASGEIGSRTVAQVQICGHTNNVDSVWLEDIAEETPVALRTIHIDGAWYYK